jgi:hypothetical protein
MLALFVDDDAVHAPDNLRGRREHVFHESFHVDISAKWRRPGVFAKRRRQGHAGSEQRHCNAGKNADAV